MHTYTNTLQLQETIVCGELHVLRFHHRVRLFYGGVIHVVKWNN